ncbi:hypothetical protein [Rhodococcus sp. WAY2]|uniref:hypothetical protein n=1 Tax=Rhodococcus sp. WAY2 TaxID=2663121 RepID=UPI001F2E49B2|nr:hypothetical protein [Rhodococcus sp. WAY2]
MLVSAGALVATTAAAHGTGYGGYPCSDQFRVPWALDTWNGTHKAEGRLQSARTHNIHCVSFHCVSFHGQTVTYQLDAQGRKHALNPSSGFLIGALASNLYFWDPASY